MTQTKRGLRTIQSKKLHSAGVQVIEGTRRWVCLTHVAAVAGGQDDSFGSSTHMMPLGTVTSLVEKPARAADSFYSIPMRPLFLRKRGVHVGGSLRAGDGCPRAQCVRRLVPTQGPSYLHVSLCLTVSLVLQRLRRLASSGTRLHELGRPESHLQPGLVRLVSPSSGGRTPQIARSQAEPLPGFQTAAPPRALPGRQGALCVSSSSYKATNPSRGPISATSSTPGHLPRPVSVHHRAGGEGFIMWRTELVTKRLPSVQLSPGLRGPEMHCRPTELPEPPTRFSALRQSPCGKPTCLSESPPPSLRWPF